MKIREIMVMFQMAQKLLEINKSLENIEATSLRCIYGNLDEELKEEIDEKYDGLVNYIKDTSPIN